MKQFLILMAMLVLMGCADDPDPDLTYEIEWDATPEEREDIAFAFDLWSLETGQPTGELVGGTVFMRFGIVPPAAIAIAKVQWAYREDDTNKWWEDDAHKELLWATIILRWDWVLVSPEYRRHVVLHEIGHVLNLRHVEDDADSVMCMCSFLPLIDDSSVQLAREQIDNGWMGK